MKNKKKFVPQLTHEQLIQLAKQEIKEWKNFLKNLTPPKNTFEKLKADGYYNSKSRFDVL